MSDTPRTDDAERLWSGDGIIVEPDFARQLERELNEQIYAATTYANDTAFARAEVEQLEKEVAALKLENATLRHHLSPSVDLIGCDICKVVLTQDQITRSPAGVNVLCPTCAKSKQGAD